MEGFIQKAWELLASAGGKILLALVVFIVGKIIIGKLCGLLGKFKGLSKLDPTVHTFVLSFVKILLYVVLVVSIIGILGVPMASVVTVLASAGVAVGLALQGALSNIAGGIMIMIFRPFNVGDYVGAAGGEGFVKSVNLFYTVLTSIDNKEITIPNGALMNANVTNFTSAPLRRVDIDFACAKGEDIDMIQNTMLDVMNGNAKVLKDPAPFARINGGDDKSMKFTLRAWCKSSDYWDVYFDMQHDIVAALGKAGVKAPAVRVVTDK